MKHYFLKAILVISAVSILASCALAQECSYYISNEIDFLADFTLPGQVTNNLVVHGDRAYVNSETELNVFDISDPEHPSMLGTFDVHRPDGIGYANGLVCLTNVGSGLLLIDVTDPANMAIAGTIYISGYQTQASFKVTGHGNYFYVARDFAGVAVVNVTNPSSPYLATTVNVTPLVHHLEVAGNYLYTIGDSSGFCVFDLANPGIPEFVALGNSFFGGSDLVAGGDHVYIASLFEGITVMDVSDPLAPVRLEPAFSTNAATYGTLEIVGDHIFAGNNVTLDAFDISDPEVPVQVGRMLSQTAMVDLQGYQLSLVGVGQARKFFTLDVAQPVSTLPLDQRDLDGDVSQIQFAGGNMYAAKGPQGLDIRGMPYLQIISATATADFLHSVTLADDKAYLAVDEAGLFILDLADPASPIMLDDINTPGHARAVALYQNDSGKYALVADTEYDVVAYDVTDPTDIRPKGVTYFTGQVRDVEVTGQHLLAADDSGHLGVIDLSVFPDPLEPTTSLELPGAPTSLFLDGNLLYVAGGYFLNVVDVSDPEVPQLLDSLEMVFNVVDVMAHDGMAYCAIEGFGLEVVDASSPANLQSLATFESQDDPTAVSTDGETVFLCVGIEGVVYLPLQCLLSPVDDDLPGTKTMALGAAYPNPFNPTTTLSFELTRSVAVDLEVYDLAGRLVRQLVAGQVRDSGRHILQWDGRNDDGRAMASGVYLYRLQAGEIHETRRMVLVR